MHERRTQPGSHGRWWLLRGLLLVATGGALLFLGRAIRDMLVYHLTGPALVAGGFAAVIFATFALVGLYALWMLRRRPAARSSRTLVSAEVLVAGSYEAVLAMCEQAIRCLGGHVVARDEARGDISAKTPLNGWSFGERVTLHVEPVSDAQCRVRMASDSLLPTTVFDWGQNRRNVRALSALLTTQTPPGMP